MKSFESWKPKEVHHIILLNTWRLKYRYNQSGNLYLVIVLGTPVNHHRRVQSTNTFIFLWLMSFIGLTSSPLCAKYLLKQRWKYRGVTCCTASLITLVLLGFSVWFVPVFTMCCGKSFISFRSDIKLKADITLDASTSLLTFLLLSVFVTHPCLRLQQGDAWTLGKDFLSVILNMHNFSHSAASSICCTLTITHFYTETHMHLWALITVSSKLLGILHFNPLVAVCWKKKRKAKEDLFTLVFFIKPLGGSV